MGGFCFWGGVVRLVNKADSFLNLHYIFFHPQRRILFGKKIENRNYIGACFSPSQGPRTVPLGPRVPPEVRGPVGADPFGAAV